MHKKSAVLLLAVLLLSLSLSGCFRPASTSPASAQGAAATATKENAFPQGTPLSGNVQDILSQTQTAAAVDGSGAGSEATATKAPKTAATPKPTKQKTPTKESNNNNDDNSTFQPNLNPERPATYTLKAGEFPICIARRYNLDAIALLSLNGLSMDSKPKAGVKLRIPESGNWNLGSRSLREHPTQYTVKGGDTYYTIACNYGDLLPDDIAAKNGLSLSDKLSAGTVLDIP